MSEKFTYSIYKKENAVHVRELFLRVFRKKVSTEYIQKKYDTFYSACNPVAGIAFLKNEPVAFYGAVPVEIKHGNNLFTAAHACDSMTLNKYRGIGLHYTLALLSYEEMKRQGIKFVFAMHSDNTLKATEKLNWSTGKPLSRFHLPTNLSPAAKLLSVFKKNKLISVKDDRASFYNPLEENDAMHIHYSEKYLSYKSFAENKIIELAGCKLWVKMNKALWIGAVNGINDTNAAETMETLKLFAQKNKIEEIIFQTTHGTAFHELLSRHLTPVDSFPLGYLPFDKTIDPEKIKLNFADLDSF